MKHIIERIVRFAKEKKTKKKAKAEEAEKGATEETSEQPPPAIDVQALLSGMAEEMESRTMLLQGEVNEEKAGEIISGFLALAHLKPPKQNLKEGEMPMILSQCMYQPMVVQQMKCLLSMISWKCAKNHA